MQLFVIRVHFKIYKLLFNEQTVIDILHYLSYFEVQLKLILIIKKRLNHQNIFWSKMFMNSTVSYILFYLFELFYKMHFWICASFELRSRRGLIFIVLHVLYIIFYRYIKIDNECDGKKFLTIQTIDTYSTCMAEIINYFHAFYINLYII